MDAKSISRKSTGACSSTSTASARRQRLLMSRLELEKSRRQEEIREKAEEIRAQESKLDIEFKEREVHLLEQLEQEDNNSQADLDSIADDISISGKERFTNRPDEYSLPTMSIRKFAPLFSSTQAVPVSTDIHKRTVQHGVSAAVKICSSGGTSTEHSVNRDVHRWLQSSASNFQYKAKSAPKASIPMVNSITPSRMSVLRPSPPNVPNSGGNLPTTATIDTVHDTHILMNNTTAPNTVPVMARFGTDTGSRPSINNFSVTGAQVLSTAVSPNDVSQNSPYVCDVEPTNVLSQPFYMHPSTGPDRMSSNFAMGSPVMTQVNSYMGPAVAQSNSSMRPVTETPSNQSSASKEDVYTLGRCMRQHFSLPRLEKVNFSGDPLEFNTFVRAFDDVIDANAISPAMKLAQLLQHCKGQAYELIEHLRLSKNPAEAYAKARDTLTFHYGNPSLMIDTFMKRLERGPPIKPNDTMALSKLASQMSSAVLVVREWNCENLLNAPMFLSKLFARLPKGLRDDYLYHSDSASLIIPSFDHLLAFVERAAHINNSFYGRTAAELDKSDKQTYNAKFKGISSYAAIDNYEDSTTLLSAVTSSSIMPGCRFCDGHHSLHRCEEFKRKDVVTRREFVRKSSLCFNCIGTKRHIAKECPSKHRCQVESCGKKHHTLLHLEEPEENNYSNGNTVAATAATGHSVSPFPVRLMVIPICVTSTESSRTYRTMAFLDPGSQRSFCSKKVTDTLHLSKQPESCDIRTANGTKKHEGHKVSFIIRGVNEKESFSVNNAFSSDMIPNVTSSIVKQSDIDKYDHLKSIQLPTPSSEVEVLLGMDVLARCPVAETIVGPVDTPVAIKYPLGWCICGSDSSLCVTENTQHEKVAPNNETTSCSIAVNFISSMITSNIACDDSCTQGAPASKSHSFDTPLESEPVTGEINFYHSSTEQWFKERPMCHLCKIVFADVYDDPFALEPSVNDRKAVKIMNDTLKRVHNNRLQIGLPWAKEIPQLPNNYEMALKRLNSLKKKLLSNSEFRNKYVEKIQEYLDNDYAERVPVDIPGTEGKTWYLPHFATKQEKFRVVFDSSATFAGTSLNANLLSGPNDNNTLVGVLLRFRLKPIAFSCDVRQMFHRVLVDPRDTDALRFLWYPDNDPNLEPVTFRMRSHVFGATSSPAVATYALRRVAQDNTSGADDDTVRCVFSNFYVDDALISCESVEKAESIIAQLVPLLATGSFHLTKFLSNSLEVLKSVPEADIVPSCQARVINDEASVSRTLGMNWIAASDAFVVFIDVTDRTCSRRGILSMVSQVYDPLGFVQPFILPAKLILQGLCYEGISWDENIPEAYRRRWVKWITKLSCLNGVVFPRCYHPNDFTPVTRELHCFSDASTHAYGACAYMKLIDENGNVHVSFVKGMSRVAPKKVMTIVRLELIAAVAALEMGRSIKLELGDNVHSVSYYTDSTTVLQIINSDSQRFKTFVANRADKIRSFSDTSQWHHVDTECNPADIASRGLMPHKVKDAGLWFNGPHFLKNTSSNTNDTFQGQADTLLHTELKVCSTITSISQEDNPLHSLLHRYSNLDKLIKAVCWLLRFKKFIIAKSRDCHGELQTTPITLDERDAAMIEIVRLSQAESLQAEMKYFGAMNSPGPPPIYMQAKRSLKSPYFKELNMCNPFVSDGILRVGGRLNHSTLPIDQRNPIILAPYHHVSQLLIQDAHQKNGHCGNHQVQSYLTQRYWIIHLQSAVSKCLKNCVPCKFRFAGAGKQFMSDLPPFRSCVGKPPFYHCYVDYFGPIKTRQGRSEVKRYGAIFTCLSTRAVHIEVAESMNTSSFLQVYYRFTCRRAKPRHMYSDNGSCFIGGERCLREGIEKWNKQHIDNVLQQNGIQWHFAPPLASHQNGVVERLVKETKKILYNLTDSSRCLTDYQLITFLAGVECILNDRPLTRVSNDPRDLTALSPNSILISKLDPSLAPDTFLSSDQYRASYRCIQALLNEFWERFIKEYLPLLQKRVKWQTSHSNLKPGDMVLVMMEECVPRGSWPKAIVEEVYPDGQNIVRRVKVRTAKSTFIRDIRKLCPIELD